MIEKSAVIVFAFIWLTIGYPDSLGLFAICGACLAAYNALCEALNVARDSEFVANAKRKLAQ